MSGLRQLLKVHGSAFLVAKELNINIDKGEELIETSCRSGVEVLPYSSELYPKKLLDTPDFPLLLYVKGDIGGLNRPFIAVIGTRQPSAYGLKMADKFAQELTDSGYTIISGLALGIDTAAHKAALYKGRTVAVLGSGIDHIYPKENLPLSQIIENKGALVSEYPPFYKPDRSFFPQRNRIIAGMSQGMLLVEAPLQSGSMIAMDKAYKYNRRCFAIPGPVDNESFKGNHTLIKQNKAKLVESTQDIISAFEDLYL